MKHLALIASILTLTATELRPESVNIPNPGDSVTSGKDNNWDVTSSGDTSCIPIGNAPIISSTWIGSAVDCSSPTSYTAKVFFTFPSHLDKSTFKIEGEWAADNNGTVYLNGSSIGSLTGDAIGNFLSMHDLNHSTGQAVTHGSNELKVVWNNTTNPSTSPSNFTIDITSATADPLPHVSVTNAGNASDNYFGGTYQGGFMIRRCFSDNSVPLTVHFTITGTATNGTDYVSIGSTATIAAGANRTSVNVIPYGPDAIDGAETVILTLNSNSAYYIDTNGNTCDPNGTGSATVTIFNN